MKSYEGEKYGSNVAKFIFLSVRVLEVMTCDGQNNYSCIGVQVSSMPPNLAVLYVVVGNCNTMCSEWFCKLIFNEKFFHQNVCFSFIDPYI